MIVIPAESRERRRSILAADLARIAGTVQTSEGGGHERIDGGWRGRGRGEEGGGGGGCGASGCARNSASIPWN